MVPGPSASSLLSPLTRPVNQRDEHVLQPRDRLLTSKNTDRSTSLLCQLQPADLAASYHRSSR
jgi:hypothetical protein